MTPLPRPGRCDAPTTAMHFGDSSVAMASMEFLAHASGRTGDQAAVTTDD